MSAAILAVVLLAITLSTAWLIAWPLAAVWGRFLASRSLTRALELARWNILLLAAPLLLGALVALASAGMLEPSLGFACHCGPGAGLHLCPHHPEHAASLLIPALLALAVLLPRAARALTQVLRGWRVNRGLARAVEGAPRHGEVRLLPLGRGNAFALGEMVLADVDWWASLSETERAMVLAHERAHLARRDSSALILGKLLAALSPPSAQALLRWWQAAAEHEADRAAAREVGDPLSVAEFLLRQHRAIGPAPAPAFHGAATERRVRALAECQLSATPLEGDLDRTFAGALFVLACGASLGAELHHAAEHLLTWLP